MRERKEKESAIESRVVRWAKEQGILHRKLNGMGNRSWPDQMFCLPNGVVAFIEFKKVGEEPTPLQYDTIKELLALKQNVTWADDSDCAIGWLKALLRKKPR